MNRQIPTMLPRAIFVADYVRPGTAYHDEPSELIPAGWWVRIDGLTDEDRESEPWIDHYWTAHYFGERAVDHVEAVVIANVANEHWSLQHYAPERAPAALRAALLEMVGG